MCALNGLLKVVYMIYFPRSSELLEQVQMLNAVRRLQEGRTLPSAFLATLLKMNTTSLDFLLQVRRETQPFPHN